MGVKNLPSIIGNLIADGKDPKTPAALVRWGTTPDQQTVTGTLEDIEKKAEEADFRPPSIFVVGEVVRLRDTLSWFETKPLFGKGVVITRPVEQSQDFYDLLSARGARVIRFPTIKIEPPLYWSNLDRAIDNLVMYSWIIFTSANGVRFFLKRLQEKGRDLRDLKNIRISSIGPATAALLKKKGIKVEMVPNEYISEGVVKSFSEMDIKGKKILLPRAEIARDILPEELAKMGAEVDAVTAYRTVQSGVDKSELQHHFDKGQVDVITFTSPSTVVNFVHIMGREFKLPEKVKIACIGPVTAAAARKSGFRIDIMQNEYTIPGLVSAIEAYFVGPKGQPGPMIGISKLYCGAVEAADVLRYGEDSGRLPSHLLQFSKDKKPVVVWNVTRRCNLRCVHCYSSSRDLEYTGELDTAEGKALITDLAQVRLPGRPALRRRAADQARPRGACQVCGRKGDEGRYLDERHPDHQGEGGRLSRHRPVLRRDKPGRDRGDA